MAFNTGSTTSLQPGAIVKEIVALHIEISKSHRVSVTSEIAALRRLLLLDTHDDQTLESVSKVVFMYSHSRHRFLTKILAH